MKTIHYGAFHTLGRFLPEVRRPVLLCLAVASILLPGCGQEASLQPGAGGGVGSAVTALMQARGLSEADVSAALKTYTPTGGRDDYLIFASGGHSGQVLVIGVPSMRILKVIAVFTPEPWQGYGYGDETDGLLAEGERRGKNIRWADTHHPALSETAGDYDGKFLFINDKANARVAVIDLHDFVTAQIVTSQLIESDHGATFVTPNTEYVVESAQYPTPLGGGYAPIEDYEKSYRGAAIFWKFDREKGRIVPEKSFAIELPPYMQDLTDAGKLVSDGWVFINSFNTERSWGGDLEGKPPLESGASQNDMDYLHVINWRAAEKVAEAGKTETIAGMRVIRLPTAIEEGLLYFVGEPKSPHGVDVTPDGKYMVVSGKLDTHTTIYDFAKIQDLIAQKKFVGTDDYGVPILPFEEAIRGQVEVGLGPLHTQYDADGNAYTSLFLESKVAKWSLADMQVIEKIPVHYNVGHILTPEGDTVSPDGKFLVSMNKWAIDRFNDVGPLLPAELPAHRYERRQDAAALRPADSDRGAPLRADDQGRQGSSHRGLLARRNQLHHSPGRSLRGEGRRGADRAQGGRRARLHDRRAKPFHAGYRCA